MDSAGYAGLKINGGMAEYMVADSESAMLLPDSLSFEQAAPLMCAGVRDLMCFAHICLINIL